MTPYLPPEILDEIVGHLKDEVPQSFIYACCLVSKIWMASCRRHCFRSIVLDSWNSSSILDLVASPLCTLAYCSSHLILSGWNFDTSSAQGSKWLIQALSLPSRAFAFVKALKMAFNHCQVSPAVMTTIPSIFPEVTKLVHHRWHSKIVFDDIARFMSSFRNLSYLDIDSSDGIFVDIGAGVLRNKHSPRPRLRGLRIYGRGPYENFLVWISSSEAPCRLESLHVWLTSSRNEALENTLRVCSDTLIHLSFEYAGNSLEEATPQINWSSFSNLQTFGIHHYSFPDDLFLAEIVSSLRSLPCLHLLMLSELCKEKKHFNASFEEPGFPALKELWIWMLEAEAKLPSCSRRGILKIGDYSVHDWAKRSEESSWPFRTI